MRPTPNRTLPTALFALLFLAPAIASAQQFEPIATIVEDDPTYIISKRLLAADAPVSRSWSAQTIDTETYRFQVTYDSHRMSATDTSSVAVLESGPDEGIVASGLTIGFTIRPSQILRGIDLSGGPTGTRTIVVSIYRASDRYDPDSSAQLNFEFEYDLDPPGPVQLKSVTPGEQRLEIEWVESTEANLLGYDILYNPNIGTTCTTTTSARTVDTPAKFGLPTTVTSTTLDATLFPEEISNIAVTQTSFSVKDGLRNGVCAVVAVRAIDEAGNEGEPSNLAVGKPVPVFDFFEYHRAAGGGEDGGFCFVATAAHDSYAHPVVRLLRGFRDVVMKRTPLGSAFVWTYYRLSPPLAEHVRHDADARAVAQLALLPVAALALLWLLAPLAGLACLLFLFRRKLGFRTRGATPSVGASGRLGALLVATVLLGAPSSADAHSRTRRGASNIGWGFQLKGGPYLPALGDVQGEGTDAVANDIAFNNVFGPDASPNALYTFGIDLTLYKGFGRLGVGGTFGFMQFVGRGVLTIPSDGSAPERSNDTTVFNIAPMSLVAFYRFDVLYSRWNIPFVPYLRGGLAYHLWWVTNGNGDISRSEEGTKEFKGQGGKLGLVGAAGVSFILNFIDPKAAASLDTSTGITSTGVFFEAEASEVDGFGDTGFDFSELTWNLGLYLEF